MTGEVAAVREQAPRVVARYRERHEASPRPGEGQSWWEWQVVVGRAVVWRGSFRRDAIARAEQELAPAYRRRD